MLALSALLGGALLAAVALLYAWSLRVGRDDADARALGFATIVFGNLFLILASRSGERSIVEALARRNVAFWSVTAAALAAMAITLYVPAAARIFRFAPLSAQDLAVALAVGACSVLWIEIPKHLARRGREIDRSQPGHTLPP